MTPTDAMIEAGLKAFGDTEIVGDYFLRRALTAAYAAMESARDPDELREALTDARWAIGALEAQLLGFAPPAINVQLVLGKVDTALSRNGGDVGHG